MKTLITTLTLAVSAILAAAPAQAAGPGGPGGAPKNTMVKPATPPKPVSGYSASSGGDRPTESLSSKSATAPQGDAPPTESPAKNFRIEIEGLNAGLKSSDTSSQSGATAGAGEKNLDGPEGKETNGSSRYYDLASPALHDAGSSQNGAGGNIEKPAPEGEQIYDNNDNKKVLKTN